MSPTPGAAVRPPPAHAGRDCQPRWLLARATGAVELDALLVGGPLEQETDLAPGTRLLAVNGTELHSLNELDALLNHQAGQRLALTVLPKGAKEPSQLEVTAIDLQQEYQLQLDGWIAKRRSQVEQLSQGRVGYVYLPEMSSAVYEEVVADALGRQRNREALIVDVRFNKGAIWPTPWWSS